MKDWGPRPAREVSPAANATVDEFIELIEAQGATDLLAKLRDIRHQKAQGLRLRPSVRLISHGAAPIEERRRQLVDAVAALVDENLFGRAEMCLQFAALLARALRELGFAADARTGPAHYRRPDGGWFTWNHAWVVYDGYVVDGNVDSMTDNPVIPRGIDPPPFWGPWDQLPGDRRLEQDRSTTVLEDEDVVAWWPSLSHQLR